MRQFLLYALASLVLVSCASPSKNPPPPIGPQFKLVKAAIAAGDVPLAEYYIEDIIRDRPKWSLPEDLRMTMAEIYWSQGKDKTLLDYSEKYLDKRQRDVWWCRVLERRGNLKQAASCWEGLGEISRMERVLREITLMDELAPEKSYFGLRRE
jgi:hypothetical protein